FDIDIVLMFLNYLSDDQKASFLEDRKDLLKDKLSDIKKKISTESETKEQNYLHLYTYLENHLKAENNWLKSIS
ncbi:MAG: hypothetical protein PF637_01185, partial [Spirochaetes bacterium]|nr:hypothetical protein [Spirochaetota bacterium]